MTVKPEAAIDLPETWFVGKAWLTPMQDNAQLSAASVGFEPCARNNWHTHTAGQLLVVTDGECLYQEEGQEARLIPAGQSVYAQAGVAHWHGAPDDAGMVHTAVTLKDAEGEQVTWGEPVLDPEYQAALAQARA